MLTKTAEHTLHSRENGDYKIMVSWPKGKAPDGGWPVIYLLDGESVFPIAATLMARLTGARGPLMPGVVVAIDYYGESRRDRDYRPAVGALALENNPSGGTYPPGAPGQAQAFWAFIHAELKPWMARQQAIDARRQALFGHSYGGLFTCWLFMTHAGAFRHCYAASPSVWWNDRYLLKQAQRWQPDGSDSRLALFVGEYEQSLQPYEQRLPAKEKTRLSAHRGQRAMVDGVRRLAEILAAKPAGKQRIDFTLLKEQSHLTVLYPALQMALMHHFTK